MKHLATTPAAGMTFTSDANGQRLTIPNIEHLARAPQLLEDLLDEQWHIAEVTIGGATLDLSKPRGLLLWRLALTHAAGAASGNGPVTARKAS